MTSTVTIDGIEYAPVAQIAARDGGDSYVIVRCKNAGVHVGYIVEQDDVNGTCVLEDSRRLWRWHGRTLSGLAIEGTDDPAKCRFGDPLPSITLRGWSEIIPCSVVARESLQSVAVWEND